MTISAEASPSNSITINPSAHMMVWGIILAAFAGPLLVFLGATTPAGPPVLFVGVILNLIGIVLIVVAAHRALTTLHQVGLALGMQDSSPGVSLASSSHTPKPTSTRPREES